MNSAELKSFLDEKAEFYNSRFFVEADPVSIPHLFSKKEDIEIAGFLSATIAWGNRKSIIQNAKRMMELMEYAPYDFVLHHRKNDLEKSKGFVHRTFNSEDFCQFINSLRHIYEKHFGLEEVFTEAFRREGNAGYAISQFRNVFFEKNKSPRTTKHVSDPQQGSSAKRMNMFLRWMVRSNSGSVDFGIWKNIPTSQLSIPLDVHTGNSSRKLGLLLRTQNDWKAVCELDKVLRTLDPLDPVKYDFALFGLGAIEKF